MLCVSCTTSSDPETVIVHNTVVIKPPKALMELCIIPAPIRKLTVRDIDNERKINKRAFLECAAKVEALNHWYELAEK